MDKTQEVAIVGISGRFPGARDLETFWANLAAGVDAGAEAPWERWELAAPDPSLKGRFLEEVECFDPHFFDMSLHEAEWMDPQQRLLLEHCWHALEDAGCLGASTGGARAGVFVGMRPSDYRPGIQSGDLSAHRLVGNDTSRLSARLSRFLPLEGPLLTVDAACASSLVAIHQACRQLGAGLLDLAVAGGVFVMATPRLHLMASSADGVVPAEGVGVVVLKSLAKALADGDHIYGVIKGSGSRQNAEVPSSSRSTSQADLIREVHHQAAIESETLSHVEMLGHEVAAAGMAGMLKLLLSLKHHQLPPSLPNRELRPWGGAEGHPRRAAISAFGSSGADCHLVLEEAPQSAPRAGEPERPAYLFLVSARTSEALAQSVANLADSLGRSLKAGESLHAGDVACTLARGRRHLEVRAAFVATGLQELISTLNQFGGTGEAPRAVVSGSAALSSRARSLLGELVGTTIHELANSRSEATWIDKLMAVAEFYALGVETDWAKLFPDGAYRRVRLPSYPFARERCWARTGREVLPASSQAQGSQVSSAKPLAPAKLPGNGVLLEKGWRAAEAPVGTSSPELSGTLVVLVNDETLSLARGLLGAWRGVRPFLVTDRTSVRGAEVDAVLDFERHEEGSRLGERIDALGAPLAGIIDLSDLHFGGGQVREETEGALGRIGLLQRLLQGRRKESFPLLHLTRGLRPFGWSGPLDLSGAVMAALIGKLGAEYANLHARTVDVDLGPDDARALEAVIRQELSSREPFGEGIHRGGRRYLPELRPIEGALGAAPSVSSDKVYVITGGVRGIGLEVARHLVSRGARRLALMGLQPLPPREQWPALLASTQTEQRLRDRIAPLHALESQGVTLRIYTGALTDSTAVGTFLRAVRANLGPIGGCFHSAGVVLFEPAAFASKPVDNLRQVFEPKISGLRSLERALAQDPLDFFVLFSSVSSAVPTLAASIADYAAANDFMNLLVEQRHAEGRTAYQSIVWPNWKEVGMGEVGSAAYRALGFTAHSTADGLAMLDAAMASGRPVPLPAVVDPERFKVEALLQFRFERQGPPAQAPVSIESPPPQLTAPQASAFTPAQARDHAIQRLRELFAQELKLPWQQIDPDADFEALGVDSIIVIDVVVAIEEWLDVKLDPTLPLLHRTLGELASYLAATHPEKVLAGLEPEPTPEPAVVVAAQPEQPVIAPPPPTVSAQESLAAEPIAVIGMACHFPRSPDLESYWRTLREGRDCISEIPASRWRIEDFHASSHQRGRSISKWGGFIEGIELFDPGYFQIAEEEAPGIDPLMRQFLEVSVQCFQHAGYPRAQLAGKSVGVFVGSRMSNYAARLPSPTRNSVIGSGQNFIAAHVSQFFDLKGPGVVVDTACSSSLVSIHLACQSLRTGESEVALAGGVDILLDESVYLTLSEGRALARDGRCKTFDERADGFVPGEGAGAVLLKPLRRALADGDRIYGVIDATAVNNDGHTMGITTPSPEGQKAVIEAALRAGRVDPGSISYVEAHGTGTMIGDPIELKALTEIFSAATSRKGYCAVGSVKSNFGHLLSAAGISGLIKVVLSLMHRELPPTLHCKTPNPRFRFEASPFYPNTVLRPWEPIEGVRRAGLSAFGFGGTNAHALLSEAPAAQSPTRAPLPPVVFSSRRYWLEKAAPAGRAPQPADSRETPRSRRPLLALELDSPA